MIRDDNITIIEEFNLCNHFSMGYVLTASTPKYTECNTNSFCLVNDSLEPLT